ncbi:MAG: hypothetical protein ACPLUL_07620 [Thermanaerothrix sp.]|uniref:hypothetical protein n=1 Tax=Thermanaerothrix sp. TaxID=2972675 RepID=UPI003C7BF5A5
MSKRLQAGLLGLVLLLGLVVRLYRLADRGIWYDDAFSILLSERPLNLIVQGTAADTMPPLYFFFAPCLVAGRTIHRVHSHPERGAFVWDHPGSLCPG